MERLGDKVAIVTGVGQGIGRAIAERLAKDGATVVVADINKSSAESVAERLSGPSLGVHTDVTDRESVRQPVKQVMEKLVGSQCWSTTPDGTSPNCSSIPTWDRVVQIDLYGVLNMSKEVLPLLAAQGSGSAVNVASDAGRVGSAGEAVYSGAKGGVIAFTKAIAREMARSHINVNCISPGLEKEVVPYRAEWDRRESVDIAIIAKLGKLGFFGLTIPEQYGGVGGDYITYCIGMEELGRADSAVRGIVSVSMGLFGKIVLSHDTEEQKQRWLPRIAAGTTLGCFALTEPDTGSDAGNLKTRAEKHGGDWIINGSKIFITNGSWADVAVVFARTGGPGRKGVSAFLVPTDTAGFTRTEIHGKFGLRGQVTSELTFSSVRILADALLGEEGEGFQIAMHSLDKRRVSVAAGCTGISQACLGAVVDYAVNCTQFGRPLASFQLIQDMIAEISVDTEAFRLLTWRAADLIERGQPFGTEASKAKYFASEKAVNAANLAIQAFGGYGYIDEYPVQKFMRDARVMSLYEGTSQTQKLLIGGAETGVNVFL